MIKEEHIKYWLESAQHDLESAKTIFNSKRYDWCLFVGHLALEKILKAIFVERNDNKMPPKMHNLVRLAELSGIELDKDQKFNLDKINDFNIQIRYPDYKLEFYKRCSAEFTSEYFGKIEEFYKWFRSLLKSKIQ
ncbi:MAG: HEPN domain-containing protein [Candidatus Scalindua sp.]|jgi:HEPN domain-containing protein|nr:HEPN domain-containing protein [Candidatus Scalindua sp.]MBT6045276.1 HEPN domain-containing protein [Candidatus Scalindua sp.]MBT6231126.1 HEPN domain-containing protein [Candidatus Scalindua sp.]MBT6564492.1 HEPN domain-containing protein [Candidatus Scalindua sp.]MBT7213066.1 HEPN domain-containing protein [Candidatus Scalindua sp.]